MNQHTLTADERMLAEFLERPDPDARARWLATQPEVARRALYSVWAQSRDLQLDDVIGLPEPRRHEMTMHLVGNKKLGIRPTAKSFIIIAPEGPTFKATLEKGATEERKIMVENGTDGKRRLFITFEEPQTLPMREALNCLLQYGAYAPIEEHRGKLKQVSAKEFAAWQLAQEEKEVSGSTKKARAQ